eukprot:TRINITY_DN11903_c0_g1_i2.p1 TRINITY_DN11903_c0_g1~~TRINITY_DN11903_c0_g1_i2.p1  ORF type:complete len:400 (+),score=84.02 TRINITY_DN11903_c0_g1_i2:38-1237(+)
MRVTRTCLNKVSISHPGSSGRRKGLKTEIDGNNETSMVFKKGSFDMSQGGIRNVMATEEELERLMEGSEKESINFEKHAQKVLSTFKSATQRDWEITMDLLLERDTYNKDFIAEWEKREPSKVRAFAALHTVLFIMADIYFVNPNRRHLATPAVIAASSRLEEKTLKAGWWQESFRKLLLQNQVEDVPYLRAIMDAVMNMKVNRFHIRNMVNSYTKICTVRYFKDTSEMLKVFQNIWGSYFLALSEVLEMPTDPRTIDACNHMGKAYALLTAIKSLMHAKVTRSVMVPIDLIEACNCDVEHFYVGKNTKGTRTVIYKLLELMLEEVNKCIENTNHMARHHCFLLLYRYNAEVEAWMKLCHHFKYDMLPQDEAQAYIIGLRWEHWRRREIIRRRIRFRSL